MSGPLADRLDTTTTDERQVYEKVMGQTANPHPSQDARYVVTVIEEDGTHVRVRYVSGGGPAAWWITRDAWQAWREAGRS